MDTQFSATPPARHKFLAPVSRLMPWHSLDTMISVTSWMEAAISMWNWVSGSLSARRTFWPNNAANRSLVMVRPVQ